MTPDSWHQTDFDPFEHLVNLTQAVNDLTAAHNRLGKDHVKLRLEFRELAQELELLKQIKT